MEKLTLIKPSGIFLLLVLHLFASCTRQGDIPFDPDTSNGEFRLHGFLYSGPVINGTSALEGAYLFHGKDSLVSINSSGHLDLVTIFKGDTLTGSLQLIIINTGEQPEEVRQLALCSRPVRLTGPGHELDLGLQDSWDIVLRLKDDIEVFGLALEHTPIVLLPEERLILPALRFFLFTLPE